jgi:DeoR/GlpR family transcriptional regulator of sugar metabolism
MKEPPELRRQKIVELASAGEYIRPADIAKALKVSGETIRRDFVILEASGSLRRMHGGAVAESTTSSEPDRASRIELRRAEKNEIAALVASLVRPTDAIFLDVGTTVEAAARALPATFSGTVITNSLIVGTILGERENIELHVLGGRMRLGEYTTYGADTEAQLSGFHADLAFLGAGGVHAEFGFTDYSSEDVPIKQLMIGRSRASYILATSDKISHVALRRVSELSEVTGVLTDSKVSAGQLASFADIDVQFLKP